MKKASKSEEKVNTEALALYVRVYRARQRQGSASTKTRAEVSGGGKKPWRQKHTGRARQGSIRAPHWVHGGISHGPKPKDWSLEIPPKIKTLALRSAFLTKEAEGKVVILKDSPAKIAKTKDLVSWLTDAGLFGKKILLVTKKYDKSLLRAGRNMQGVEIQAVGNLNAYSLLKSRTLVLTGGSESALKGKV